MAQFSSCPKCQGGDAEPVKFTWWGGVLGPRLFHHVRCRKCGNAYNGKSGKSNDTAIAVYLIVGVIVGIAVGCIAFFAARG